MYLAAIIDLYSRKVLSWTLSNKLDVQFCLDAFGDALKHYGKPEIINSDQGSQFARDAFTGRLQDNEIKSIWSYNLLLQWYVTLVPFVYPAIHLLHLADAFLE